VTTVPPLSPQVHQADDDLLRPTLAGAIAGLAGGIVWAAIVGLANAEIGWIAWGIGALIGWAMCRVTPVRSTRLAAMAATLALMSLLLGKVLIQQFVIGPGVEREILEDERVHAKASGWQLYRDKAFPAAIQGRIDAIAESDTMSDALWEEAMAVADSHSAALSEEARTKLLTDYTAAILADFGPWQQLLAQFTFWDVLWFGLAITTAWKLLKREAEPTDDIPGQPGEAGTNL
jgi:hypothetical protein